MIIDFSTHPISKSVGEMLAKDKWYGGDNLIKYPVQNADPEVRLALMEKYRIDTQALSQTTPVLVECNPIEAAEICRLSNDDNYALCKASPKKFVNICITSLPPGKAAAFPES